MSEKPGAPAVVVKVEEKAAAASPSPALFVGVPMGYTQKVLIAVAISLAAVLLAAFVYFASDVLVLCFAGLLFSVFLSAPSALLVKYAKISRGYALTIVLLTLAMVVFGGAYFMGFTVYRQSQELTRSVPGALYLFEADLRKELPQNPGTLPATTMAAATTLGTEPATMGVSETQTAIASTRGGAPVLVAETQSSPATFSQWLAEKFIEGRKAATDFFTSASFASHAGGLAGGVVTSTFGLIGNLVVVFGVGLFFAMTPGLYINGVVAMFPMGRRLRVRAILGEVGTQLQWWFVGQLCSMVSIGLLTFIGLKILGVPMATALAILAGLMNFIPNFGPILAAIPAVLVAFAPHDAQKVLSPAMAGWTMLLYVIIQLLEGWVITPFFQKRAVELPAALIVIAQMLFALMLGPVGLILATPILAATLVLVRMVYVEDVLGDRSFVPHKHGAAKRGG